jgi:phage shock protein C
MKRLYRSERDRMLGGVCGGLGDYFGIDPTMVRLGWVVLTLFPTCGFGIIAYIIAAIIIPRESQVRAD